ncbi:MAG: hypothetical protein PHT58_00680 [Eubacteriales bacterium]|nr:hypothetical protein [Eubacteriales bacterium]
MTSRKELWIVLANPQYATFVKDRYVASDDAPQEVKDAVALVNANRKKNPHYYE